MSRKKRSLIKVPASIKSQQPGRGDNNRKKVKVPKALKTFTVGNRRVKTK